LPSFLAYEIHLPKTSEKNAFPKRFGRHATCGLGAEAGFAATTLAGGFGA